MAKRVDVLCLVICCLLIGLSVWAAALTKSVQVRTGQLRQHPSFLGQVIKEVPYGEQVQVLTEQPPWFRIMDTAGSQGWMHDSALTAKRIVLQDSGDVVRTAVTSDEIALAGKGFNAQVEAEFQRRNPAIHYIWVDRMEHISISIPEMEQFLHQGGVKPAQGGM